MLIEVYYISAMVSGIFVSIRFPVSELLHGRNVPPIGSTGFVDGLSKVVCISSLASNLG